MGLLVVCVVAFSVFVFRVLSRQLRFGGTMNSDRNMDGVSPDLLIICQLVAFVVSTIVKSEEEWREWGQPFLQATFIAQFGEAQGVQLTEQLHDKFHPLITEKTFLWVDQAMEEDYAFVSHAEHRLQDTLRTIGIDASLDLDQALKTFLDNFFKYCQSSVYDARARVTAKKICNLLNLAAHDFSELERSSLSHQGTFLESFNESCSSIPRASLLTSYRMLKVAVVAVGGGALVGMASVVAAPTIITTIVPLLTATSDLLQVSVALEGVLAYVGVLAYPVIPSLFGSYGTSFTGYTMMKRTAELEEFDLMPLANLSCKSTGTGAGGGGALTLLVAGHTHGDDRSIWGADGASHLLDEEAAQEVDKEQGLLAGMVQAIAARTAALGHPLLALVSAEQVKEQEPAQDGPVEALESAELSEALVVDGGDWEALTVTCKAGWWRSVLHTDEAYAVRWETSLRGRLQDSFLNMLTDSLYGRITGELYGQVMELTPLPLIKRAAGMPLSVLKKIETLADPWVMAMDRARQAGALLARTLLLERRKGAAGGGARPVNLIGYGMGARVVYHALETLAASGIAGRGIVEHAVLIGAPVGCGKAAWAAARDVVAGRLVNCYSTSDWILALLYRAKSLDIAVAGLQEVLLHAKGSSKHIEGPGQQQGQHEVGCLEQCLLGTDVREVENIDVTHLAKNHSDYPAVLKDILMLVDLQ